MPIARAVLSIEIEPARTWRRICSEMTRNVSRGATPRPVTMYDGKVLIKNPINRYLINSPTQWGMKKNEEG